MMGEKNDYTLVEQADDSEENTNADLMDGSNSSLANQTIPQTYEPSKCVVNSETENGYEKVVIDIKAEAIKVFQLWDKCKYANDYKEPNNSSRKLLSQSIIRPQRWNYPTAPNVSDTEQVCGGPTFPCPQLSECEELAARVLCNKLARCTDPVCSSFYTEIEIERICGICSMSWWSRTLSCFGPPFKMLKCMGLV
jgi:hypothetical protein